MTNIHFDCYDPPHGAGLTVEASTIADDAATIHRQERCRSCYRT